MKRNLAYTKKQAASAKDKLALRVIFEKIKAGERKYDKQISIQIDQKHKPDHYFSRIEHHKFKWAQHGLDEEDYKIIFYDSRNGSMRAFEEADESSDDDDDDAGACAINYSGKAASSIPVPDFSILRILSNCSRLYINAHGDKHDGVLSGEQGMFFYDFPAEKIAEIIASNVNLDAIDPKKNLILPHRRLRISVTACVSARGHVKQLRQPGDLINSSFCAKLSYLLYKQYNIDCEVVGRLGNVAKMSVPSLSFELGNFQRDHILASQADLIKGKSFKELGRLKVVFYFRDGQQVMDSAYPGRHSWVDFCFDYLNQLYITNEDMGIKTTLVTLINEISLTIQQEKALIAIQKSINSPTICRDPATIASLKQLISKLKDETS